MALKFDVDLKPAYLRLKTTYLHRSSYMTRYIQTKVSHDKLTNTQIQDSSEEKLIPSLYLIILWQKV